MHVPDFWITIHSPHSTDVWHAQQQQQQQQWRQQREKKPVSLYLFIERFNFDLARLCVTIRGLRPSSLGVCDKSCLILPNARIIATYILTFNIIGYPDRLPISMQRTNPDGAEDDDDADCVWLEAVGPNCLWLGLANFALINYVPTIPSGTLPDILYVCLCVGVCVCSCDFMLVAYSKQPTVNPAAAAAKVTIYEHILARLACVSSTALPDKAPPS